MKQKHAGVSMEEALSDRWRWFMGLVSVLGLLALVAVLGAGCGGGGGGPEVMVASAAEPLGAEFYDAGLSPSAVAWAMLLDVWLAAPEAVFLTYSAYLDAPLLYGVYVEDGWLGVGSVPEVAVAEAWASLYME